MEIRRLITRLSQHCPALWWWTRVLAAKVVKRDGVRICFTGRVNRIYWWSDHEMWRKTETKDDLDFCLELAAPVQMVQMQGACLPVIWMSGGSCMSESRAQGRGPGWREDTWESAEGKVGQRFADRMTPWDWLWFPRWVAMLHWESMWKGNKQYLPHRRGVLWGLNESIHVKGLCV